MNDSPRKRRWYAAAAVAVTAVLAFFANLDGSLSFLDRVFGDNSNETAIPTLGRAAPKSSTTVSAPTVAATTTTTAPPPSQLLINLSVDPVSSAGKDKAIVGREGGGRVFIAHSVFDDAGEVRDGCHLSWELYRNQPSKLLERGSGVFCGIDALLVGKRVEMPPGRYRVEVKAELDNGTTGSVTYTFSTTYID
jgi:hypothetical protein